MTFCCFPFDLDVKLLKCSWSFFSHVLANSVRYTYIYLLYTYSPKRYVVNFRTQISSSQSEERTMVFTSEKHDTSNHNRERCFFTCEKNDTSNQNPQRCASFAPKFPPFLAACWVGLATSCRWIPKKLPIKVSKSCQKVAIFFKRLPKSCQNFSAFRTFFGC